MEPNESLETQTMKDFCASERKKYDTMMQTKSFDDRVKIHDKECELTTDYAKKVGMKVVALSDLKKRG